MTNLETDYLTATQVARWLQVSEKSVYRWASHDPGMPALRIGGVIRFPRERLERWVRSREQGTGGARRVRQSGSAATPEPLGSATGVARPSVMCAIPRASRLGTAMPATAEEHR
jgi:excisionase family DNA binding protein